MQPLHGLYPNMETCNHDILLQHKKGEEKVPLHQQCTTWILIFPWWHQTLCERQQMWICYWLAIVPNKWSLYQYLEGEELVLEYAKFQLQQREIFWPDCRLSTNVTLPIHSFHLCRPLNLDALSTSNFSKIMHHNAIIRAIEDTNKLENDGLMDKYYVVGVIAIPYPRFGMFTNIISIHDNSWCVAIDDIPQYACMDFIKLSSMALGKKEFGVLQTFVLWDQISTSGVNYDNKFIHTPTYTYNKIMLPLELVGVIENE